MKRPHVNKVFHTVLLLLLVLFTACEWRLKPVEEEPNDEISVVRYDRVESLYLTTGDFSALQQMNTGYPQQTRTLIEDMLGIGHVNDPDINTKFLTFYQDTTLQILISEVEQQYANMDDVNDDLTNAFDRLRKLIPGLNVPLIYAQIGSLDQSIVVSNDMLGISLDKYLGADHPLYLRSEYGYTDEQRQMMTREYIVPDCLGFYLLSLYPMPEDRELSQLERDIHMAKIQWTVNKAMNRRVFDGLYVRSVDHYMNRNKNVTTEQMLRNNNYREIR